MRGLLLEKKKFFFCPSFQLPFSVKMAARLARVVVTVYFDESIDFFPTLCNLQHRFVQKSIIFVKIEQNLFTLPRWRALQDISFILFERHLQGVVMGATMFEVRCSIIRKKDVRACSIRNLENLVRYSMSVRLKPKVGCLSSINDRWTHSSFFFDVRKMMFE